MRAGASLHGAHPWRPARYGRPVGGRNGNMRGLAIHGDKLIINTPGAGIVALSAINGEKLWERQIGERFAFGYVAGPLPLTGFPCRG